MEAGPDRGRGLSLIAVGLGVVVLAVLLFGLETESGDVDWISVITAVAGAVMVVIGSFLAYRDRRTSGGSKPNTAG